MSEFMKTVLKTLHQNSGHVFGKSVRYILVPLKQQPMYRKVKKMLRIQFCKEYNAAVVIS